MHRLIALTALATLPLIALGCGEVDRVADGGEESGQPIDRVGLPCAYELTEATCGEGGVQYCSDIAGLREWGPCMEIPECTPGETTECGNAEVVSCELYGGVPGWDAASCGGGGEGGGTPLVLKFDGGVVEFTASAAPFDISGQDLCLSTDWPSARTPWLAIDLDQDGVVDAGRELFGSGSILADGRHADNGFQALAPFDTDADGWITSADARYGELVAWADEDGDRVGTLDELTPISELGISALEVNYDRRASCDARGNCEIERASFSFAGGSTGEIVDVHLACQ